MGAMGQHGAHPPKKPIPDGSDQGQIGVTVPDKVGEPPHGGIQETAHTEKYRQARGDLCGE